MALTDRLARCPLVAILRGIRPEEAVPVVDALVGEGVVVAEVPLNSPDPFLSIARLVERFGDTILIGAGTVRSTDDVKRLRDVGGRLVVTPHADVAVVRAAKEAGLVAVPGFLTPTEAFALLDAGADALKLFPAEAASPAVLKSIRAVLPAGTAILPVGGIAADTMAPWLKAGAAGFGIGSSIYAPGDAPDAVAAKARRLVTALAASAA